MPRGIPNARATEEQSERRRRRGSTVATAVRLGVNEKLLDHKKYQYRWINDDAARIHMMTKSDDYDLVIDPEKATKEDSTDLGSAVSVVTGRDKNGNPQRSYLARKLREYYEADQRAKFADLDETMKGIKRGKPQGEEAAALAGTSYVPDTGININEGSRR